MVGPDHEQGATPVDVSGSLSVSALLDGVELERLSHYRLLGRVGEGAMGVVYAAYDETLARKVAIKLVHTRTTESRLRLVREAKAMARLTHANVVRVYEVGESTASTNEEALAFIVMEFVDGATLSAWLREPRTRGEVVEAFVAAGRGLAAAHRGGLVHRDFKPQNVLVDGDDRVLVTDFGLARDDEDATWPESDELPKGADADERRSSVLARITAHSAIVGTPAYMAPERFLGLESGPPSDQFSFCVALWEALHGQRPFAGHGFTDLSTAVMSGVLVKPERSDVPAWLTRILVRGLAVEPHDRWPSMDALLHALSRDPTQRRRRLLAAGVVAGLTGLGVGAFSLVQDRNEGIQRQATIEACEAEGAAIQADWNDEVEAEIAQVFESSKLALGRASWEPARDTMQAYVGDWATRSAEACIETRVEGLRSEAQYAVLARCLAEHRATFASIVESWRTADDGVMVEAPVAAYGLASLDECSDAELAWRISAPAGDEAQVMATRIDLRRAFGLGLSGKQADALALASASLDEAKRIGWRPLMAEAQFALGRLQMEAKEFESARKSLTAAYLDAEAGRHDLEVFRAASTLTHVVGDGLANVERGLEWAALASSYVERLNLHGSVHESNLLNNLGNVHYKHGAFPEATVALRRSLELAQAWFGPEHPEIAAELNNLGAVEVAKGDYDKALEYFERAVAIRERAFGAKHPSVARTRLNIGAVYLSRGQFEAALQEFQRSMSLLEAAYGPKHSLITHSLINIGGVYSSMGKTAEARAIHERCLPLLIEEYGPEHSNVAVLHFNIAMTLLADGDNAGALEHYRTAEGIFTAAFGREHPSVADTLGGIANALIRLGRYHEANVALDEGMHVLEIVHDGADHPDLAWLLDYRSAAALGLGDAKAALRAAERSLAVREAKIGPENERVATSLVHQAQALRALGRDDAARAALERGLSLVDDDTSLPELFASVANELASLLDALGEHARAEQLTREARERLGESE